MNNPHTPGPWNLHAHYDGAPMAVERADGSAFVAWDLYIAHGDKVIADVIARTGYCGWPHVDNACEMKANARLIAAAPELLAALREVVQNEAAWREMPPGFRRDASAAIAKAEGQS